MTQELLVATRKGLFILQRNRQGRWQPAQTHFLGEPVSMVLPDPRDGTLYAALNLGHFGVKLWRRRTGQEWQPCAVPVYPSQPEAGVNEALDASTWSLEQIWVLETAGDDAPGTLWAGTIPGGLFRSDDGGDSWTLNHALWDRPERREWGGGGYDHAGIHSICVDPTDRRHVSIAVSTGGVWQTHDGGAQWTCTSTGMYAEYMPPERREDPIMQDVHRMVHCAAQPASMWAQHHNGIFRSDDGGQHWHDVQTRPSTFGFAVAAHPREPGTAWFVPAAKDACRTPVDAHLIVNRTRDGGRTFEALDRGLPDTPSYDLIYRHGLAVDDTGECLAIGSTTGGLWTSDDGGDQWHGVDARLPPVYCVRFA